MNKKISVETLPARWRKEMVSALRFPPIALEWSAVENGDAPWDALLCARMGQNVAQAFAVFYLRDATPHQIALTLARSERKARDAHLAPLILAPYLSEERLLALEAQQTSGLDLCGNGVLVAPEKFLLFRTGRPNRFPRSRPLKNAYRGASSLVARAFLLRPHFADVGTLHQEIARRGGVLSLSAVSKALRELEEDSVVQRARDPNRPQARTLTLLQPEKLLARLEENYAPPRVRNVFSGKVELGLHALQEAILENARVAGVRLLATGTGSATQYASLAMEKTLSLYAEDAESLLRGLPVSASSRFPNLSLQETEDPTAYFDPRPDEKGFPWASPLTALLEMAQGEPRLAQSAEPLRKRLLQEIEGKEEEAQT